MTRPQANIGYVQKDIFIGIKNGRMIFKGPRGGRYYYDENDKKRYLKKGEKIPSPNPNVNLFQGADIQAAIAAHPIQQSPKKSLKSPSKYPGWDAAFE